MIPGAKWRIFVIICPCSNLEEAESRALDNLGRTYAKKGEYQEAIQM